MKNIFIIPARAGSKGIPNKNIKLINEVPMFAWSIIHAKYISKTGDLICVSSDREEYLKIAEEWGARTRLRPKELATDDAPTEPVMEDVINQFELNENDNVILLEPTTPLRSKESLETFMSMIDSGEKSIVSVKEAYEFEWEKSNEKYFSPKYIERTRRQDMKPKYIENGSLYFTKINVFKKLNNRVDKLSKLIVMNDTESIDVDNIEQLNLVNMLGLEFNKQWNKEIATK